MSKLTIISNRFVKIFGLILVAVGVGIGTLILINFLGDIGILRRHSLEGGGFIYDLIALGIFLFVAIPVFIFLFLQAKDNAKKMGVVIIFAIVPWILISYSYSWDSLGPYKLKYWFREPSNFDECKEMQRGASDRSVKVTYEHCWVGRGGWGYGKYFVGPAENPEKILVENNKPYLEGVEHGDILVEIDRGQVRSINLTIVDPLKRKLNLNPHVNPVERPYDYKLDTQFVSLRTRGAPSSLLKVVTDYPSAGHFTADFAPLKITAPGKYKVDFVISDADSNLLRGKVEFQIMIR